MACIVSCVCILCWCTVHFLGDPGHGEGNLRRTILERNRCPCHESPHTVTFFSYILHYQYCRPVSDSRRPCIHRHVEIRLYYMSPSSRSFLESASACYDDCTRRTHRQFAIRSQLTFPTLEIMAQRVQVGIAYPQCQNLSSHRNLPNKSESMLTKLSNINIL